MNSYLRHKRYIIDFLIYHQQHKAETTTAKVLNVISKYTPSGRIGKVVASHAAVAFPLRLH